MTLAVAGRPEIEVPSIVDSTDSLIRLVIEKGGGVEALERLVALKVQESERHAAQEFLNAMAAFRAECPVILKNKTAEVKNKEGRKLYEYKYADLPEISRIVDPLLMRHRLSYSWDSDVKDGCLICVCTVRHVNGHARTAQFITPINNPSAMNDQQKHGAAFTFARRYSLTGALGLTTAETDVDGAVSQDKITDDQADTLQAMLEEHDLKLPRFLKWAGVESLRDILASRYTECVKAIQSRGER